MVAALADIENGIEVRGLARAGQHRGVTALKLADLFSHIIVRGVLQSGIEISARLKVEKLAHRVAGVISESGALVNGYLSGLALMRLPSAGQTDRIF